MTNILLDVAILWTFSISSSFSTEIRIVDNTTSLILYNGFKADLIKFGSLTLEFISISIKLIIAGWDAGSGSR